MDENQQIREELWKAVDGLSDEQLNKQVEKDHWSIIQILEHLYLTETAVTKSIAVELKNEESQPADNKPIHLALDRSTKIQAPAYARPSDKFQTLSEVKQKLQNARTKLIEVCNEADPFMLDQKSFMHPVFGPMSIRQWIPFVGLHEKRHLEQIEELKKSL
ncbi:DinB family protein [Heyndrickxia acidicola]|uniref:DinB family protein n=1 Tax=Heyndrickxia acidicola TaxID=209389 RepID=A0ABU6MNG2_9BACI|nr:DinB family protein [Heyndrickxia acidicola]MED1205521.1 DinB family protein [Heyndrickxia acidicola]